MKNKGKKNSILTIAAAAGFFLVVLTVVFFIVSGSSFFQTERYERYQKALREFDALFSASKNADALHNVSMLENKLKEIKNLNKKNPSLQTTLSSLKRQREFSKYIKSYYASYEKELSAALKKYPLTIQLLALAVEKELQNGIPDIYSALKIGSQYKNKEWTAYPAEIFLSGTAELLSGKEKEYLLVDAALLSIISNIEKVGVLKDAESVFFPLQIQSAENVNTLRFAAEYAYDAGEFALSSRLFAALPLPDALARAGDAQFLAGGIEGAENLWRLAGDDKSLYNYAKWTKNEDEKKAALEKIMLKGGGASLSAENKNAAYTAAFTLYTRLLDDERAAAFFALSPDTENDALLDLELWRRTEKKYPPDRSLAEMWRLVGRHKTSTEVYSYAAWYFARERRYDELALLLRNARLPAAEVDFLPLAYWEVFEAARVSDNVTAINALEAYSKNNGSPWFAEANAALYLESSRDWQAAERHYYNALLRTENPREKARILERIARCHTAQGRTNEAHAALEEALLLDSENLRVRSSLYK